MRPIFSPRVFIGQRNGRIDANGIAGASLLLRQKNIDVTHVIGDGRRSAPRGERENGETEVMGCGEAVHDTRFDFDQW